MGQASGRRGQLSDDCRTDVAQNIVDFLRRRYPANTAVNVGADTGIPIETVQKMIDRVSMPSGFNLLRLMGTYGPELICAALDQPFEWASKAAHDVQLERAERNLAEALAARDALRSRP